jgi:ElaA protein
VERHPPAPIELSWAPPEQLPPALALREEVFVREQGVAREEEIDGRDGEALHLLARERGSGEVVGTLRLLFDGRVAKIGRVAVARPFRRRGIAAGMLALALTEAAARGATRARLAAQLDAIELYRGAGFEVESDPFVEAGIDHVWMGRPLAPSVP